MKSLRVMTWNLQQLPWLARKIGGAPIIGSTGGGGPEPDPKGRATKAARAILDMAPREQPDVIAFNEAFSEDARPRLIKMLKPAYPHVIEKLEHPGFDVEEDSGLMLFSKLPFLPLPTGGTHFFEPYKRAQGDDAKVAKGIGIVRVNAMFDPVQIAFTHLQASYDAANTEHMDVRADQFQFIRECLWKVADGNLQIFANSVIIGDLNVKGDPDDTSGEWNLVFAGTPPKTFGADFEDGWRSRMHPPRDLTDYDPGYTQRDTASGIRNRYDYQCTRRDANVDIGLVPHYMTTPFQLASEVTDHWPFIAHLHRISPNCSPSLAVELLKLPANNQNQAGSKVWTQQTNFRDEDMCHWVYIADAGTYSVWLSPVLEVAAFRRSDFMHALDPTNILSTTQLPGPVQTALTGGPAVRQPFFAPGKVFSCREPFFLRIRGQSPAFSGQALYGVIRHRGESYETAIDLEPHLAVDPGLPLGQKLGTTDECHFRALRPNRYSQKPYDDSFRLDNPGLVPASLELHDAGRALQPPPVSGTGPTLQVTRNGSEETVYLILRRGSLNDTNFTVTWDCPLTFVALDESFRLHVDDETGPDWPGADELDLAVGFDDDSVYDDSWDDADAGEDWPDLVQSIRTSVLGRQPQAKWAAFTDAIGFDTLKTDGLFAHGSAGGFIHKLSPADRDKEVRTASIKISDPIGDGHLTAYATLSKFPPF